MIIESYHSAGKLCCVHMMLYSSGKFSRNSVGKCSIILNGMSSGLGLEFAFRFFKTNSSLLRSKRECIESELSLTIWMPSFSYLIFVCIQFWSWVWI